MNWYELFPAVFNMSLTASIVILFVLIVRLLLRRVSKIFSYALWAVVLFRLLCPMTLSSEFSLLSILDLPVSQTQTLSGLTSSIEYIPHDIVHTENPEVHLPGLIINEIINDRLLQGEEQLVADPLEAPFSLITYLWMGGMIIMIGHGCISYLRLKKRLIGTVHLKENVYLSDYIESPFVLGWLAPKIYLPVSLDEKEQEYILLHEKHHIKRFDHIIKTIAYLALCIHWFNPLVWLAFVLAEKDMEMSCDEAVIQMLGEEIRADYSASLLNLAVGHHSIGGVPLAFTETDTKTRIKNLSVWKKPVVVVSVLATVLVIVFSFILFSNPLNTQKEVLGSEYSIKEVLYAVTVGEQLSEKIPLSYTITADYHLYVQNSTEEDWIYLGKLEPYELTNSELEQYMPVDVMREKYNVRTITDSYYLQVENDNFYLVFSTKDGKTYLGYGWEDISERYQDVSDDTRLRRLYQLESTMNSTSFHVNFFKHSLIHQTGVNVDPFSYTASDDFPGFIIVGFMANGTSQTDMTDMGYAIFKQGVNYGYRLIECHHYPNAAIENGGILFCSDPATMNTTGELVIKETYDVILSCNENLATVQQEYRNSEGIIKVIEEPVHGKYSLTLFGWGEDEGANSSITTKYLDKDGYLVNISDEPVLYWPDDTNLEEMISKLILDYYHESDESLIPVTSYRLLATSVHNDTITGQTKMMESYMLILYQTYRKDISNGDVLTPVTSIYTPAVITWSGGEGGYRLAEFWIPQQGSTYEQEIRAKFLDDIVDKALEPELYYEELSKRCEYEVFLHLIDSSN